MAWVARSSKWNKLVPKGAWRAIALAAGAGLSGCSGLNDLPGADTTGTVVDQASNAVAAATSGLTDGFKTPKGSPQEVYSRIARGAHNCWLGPHGPLKGSHKFFGQLQPERKGGQGLVELFEKTRDPNNPRGLRAFSVTISDIAGGATISVRNARLGKDLDDRFRSDVHRWASGEEGCVAGGIRTGWTPDSETPKRPPDGKKR